MAYRFKRGETIEQNIKRIAVEELSSAARHLRGMHRNAVEESVHEVRKSIKKIRAVLRLVRSELGDVFDTENDRLRDVGRELSQLRDAGVMNDTLQKLLDSQKPPVANKSLAAFRHEFSESQDRLEHEVNTQGILRSLLTARNSVRYWPLGGARFATVEHGMRRTFAGGRKALKQARKTGRREDFHEWRKRVKDRLYHTRLLEKAWTEPIERHERRLHRLEDALGDDLNLAMLAERIRSLAGGNGTAATAAEITRAIDAASRKLRSRALDIGERLYRDKAGEFARKIRHLGKDWR